MESSLLFIVVFLIISSHSQKVSNETIDTIKYIQFGQEKSMLIALEKITVSVKSIQGDKERKTLVYGAEKDKIGVEGTLKEDKATVTINVPTPAQSSPVAVSKFDITLELKNKNDGYWKLINITVNFAATYSNDPINFDNSLFISEEGMEAPKKMSFHCGLFGPLFPARIPEKQSDKPSASNSTYTIYISLHELQLQTFGLEKEKFGDAYECTGFFTAGIWMGIFINIILISIITWGLAMIMSVKTMDRFDDPKGKSVSFAGNE